MSKAPRKKDGELPDVVSHHQNQGAKASGRVSRTSIVFSHGASERVAGWPRYKSFLTMSVSSAI